MERSSLLNEFDRIVKTLDPLEYPEIYGYAEGFIKAPESDISLYDIAGKLCSLDKRKKLPDYIFDLIVKLYESEIEKGNINAMNDLGALYYDSRGRKSDYSKSVFYYEMAAKHGHRIAQENLGYCYYYGRNVEKDYEKAFKYFSLGALCGMPISLYKLGDMYQNGYFVEKNEKEAFCIYDRCLDLINDDNAKFVAGPVYLRIGNAFLKGLGTNKDAKAALICFQRAENYLYDMVASGDYMYKKSLDEAQEGENLAREILNKEIQF